MVCSFYTMLLGAHPWLKPQLNFLSRFRKINCDGVHPVCSTCIRRRCPMCDYDDEPTRRGPDRHPRVRAHQDAEPFPSSTPLRRAQKQSSNDVVATPITPSTTEYPPYTTSDASATTSRMGLSNRSPIPPRGSFDSTRLYPSPNTSRLFHQGSMNETPTHDLFSGSPSMRPSHTYLHHSGTSPPTRNDSQLLPPVSRPGRSGPGVVLNSFSVLHPEPSPSTGARARDQIGNVSFLLNHSDERPYPKFSRRNILETRPTPSLSAQRSTLVL
jgi:hypothetical protein